MNTVARSELRGVAQKISHAGKQGLQSFFLLNYLVERHGSF